MKTILVPIDFSENSRNALDYAIMIAQNTKASIILMNAQHIGYPDPFFPWSALSSIEATDQIAKELNKYCNEVIDGKHVRCTSIQEYGDPVEVIASLSKTNKIDLIIMGTQGAGAGKKRFIGSITKGVITKASCPVIAVPVYTSNTNIYRITYATDYQQSDMTALKKLADIFKPFNFELNIIHISAGAYSEATEKLIMNKFTNEAADVMDYGNISFEILENVKTEDALIDLVENKKTDLLVMSMKKRNFLENLLENSMTKDVLPHLRIPLMVFHYKEEPVYLLS